MISAGAVPVKICSGQVELEDGKRAMAMILYHCVLPEHDRANIQRVGSNICTYTYVEDNIASAAVRQIQDTAHSHAHAQQF